MKATIDQEGCIGCALCESICPSVFCMGTCDTAEVCGELTEDNEGDAREAESSCPVGVIHITE